MLEVDRERVLFIDCDLNLAILPRVVNLVLLVSVFDFVVIVWIIWGPPTASEYIEFPSHRSVLPPRRRPRPRAGLRNVFFGRARRSIVGHGFFELGEPAVFAGVVLGFLEVLERDVCLLVFCDDQDADLAVLRPGHGVDDGDELAVQVRDLVEADELRLDALGEPAGGSRSVGGGSRSVGLRWL